MTWDWLVMMPTVLILVGLLAVYIWLGRTHKKMWGETRGLETEHKPSPVKTPFWRGGGG